MCTPAVLAGGAKKKLCSPCEIYYLGSLNLKSCQSENEIEDLLMICISYLKMETVPRFTISLPEDNPVPIEYLTI
jgi:hypothetical protein